MTVNLGNVFVAPQLHPLTAHLLQAQPANQSDYSTFEEVAVPGYSPWKGAAVQTLFDQQNRLYRIRVIPGFSQNADVLQWSIWGMWFEFDDPPNKAVLGVLTLDPDEAYLAPGLNTFEVDFTLTLPIYR